MLDVKQFLAKYYPKTLMQIPKLGPPFRARFSRRLKSVKLRLQCIKLGTVRILLLCCPRIKQMASKKCLLQHQGYTLNIWFSGLLLSKQWILNGKLPMIQWIQLKIQRKRCIGSQRSRATKGWIKASATVTNPEKLQVNNLPSEQREKHLNTLQRFITMVSIGGCIHLSPCYYWYSRLQI